MRNLSLVLSALTLSFAAQTAAAADEDDIREVLDDYLRFETDDLRKQQDLMTDNSIFVNPGRRHTVHERDGEVQVAMQKMLQELDPDTRLLVNAEDVIIRIYGGDAAIVSFYRFWDRIPSVESVRSRGSVPPSPPPNIVTLVMVKESGDWKIALRQNSRLHPNN